jgi:hypothetical protein
MAKESKVDPAVEAFMRGEDLRGSRTSTYSETPEKSEEKDKPREPSGIRHMQIELQTGGRAADLAKALREKEK